MIGAARSRALPLAGLAAALLASATVMASGPIPRGAGLVDTSHPDHVIGNGTAASCTSAKVVAAVARCGIIRFRCGPLPVVIEMTETARVFNDRPGNNRAIGTGANPPAGGTPGGGNGGAIYNDGNTMVLRLVRTQLTGNRSEGGGGSAIFFVSNDRSGDVRIIDAVLTDNTGDGFSTHPGIFFLGRSITFTRSTAE